MGTIRRSLAIAGQPFESQRVAAIVRDMTSVAKIVFASSGSNSLRAGNCDCLLIRERRRAKVRIATWRYEQMAVAAARPAVARGQSSVRFRMMLAMTAMAALIIGVLESCIE